MNSILILNVSNCVIDGHVRRGVGMLLRRGSWGRGVEELERVVVRAFEVVNKAARVAVRRGWCGAARLAGSGDARTARQPRAGPPAHRWMAARLGCGREWHRCAPNVQRLRRRPASRRSTQIFQRGERSAIGRDQHSELLSLRLGQGAGQAAPETQGRAIAHTADQALQRGDAWQQYLVRQQPSGCPVEQQPRAVISGPAQHIEPAGQPKSGDGVLLQIAEPVAFADHGDMTPALSPVAE